MTAKRWFEWHVDQISLRNDKESLNDGGIYMPLGAGVAIYSAVVVVAVVLMLVIAGAV
jgi:hypothetical protein